MKDLIAKLQMDANCALGAIWLHIEAREKRIAELEAELAKLRAGAQVVAEPVAHDKAISHLMDAVRHHGSTHTNAEILAIYPKFTTEFLPASADKLREAIASISNNAITEAWESCGGVDGFYKSFGYQQFAHTVLDLAADTVCSTAVQAPVREVPEGWQLVPKEPTAEMCLVFDDYDMSARQIYTAMLAAAPLPATPVQEPKP